MEQSYAVTYRVSETFAAPLDFVYSWCTDFHEDDLKMLGSRNKRRIIERTAKRVIWWIDQPGSKSGLQPFRVVWLSPPDGWHLETCGDGREVGDYKLTALGAKKTRLDMVFRATFDERKDVEDSETLAAEGRAHWKEYAKFLHRDYEAAQTRRAG